MRKIEHAVPRFPQVYRVFVVDESGKESPTSTFRVRKRVKVDSKWTTKVQTFTSFEKAKLYSKQKVQVSVSGSPCTLTFKEAFDKFLFHKEFEQCLSPGTIQGYKIRARHFEFFHTFNMKTMTPRLIDTWVDLMLDPIYKARQQKSRTDYDHELTLLNVFFRFYRDFIDDSFQLPIVKRHRLRLCPPKRRSQEIRFLSESEEVKFLDALKNSPMLFDLALFQLQTGCRIGEAAALEFNSVEFHREQVHIRAHLHWDRTKGGRVQLLPGTKTGLDRCIPLSPVCLKMLRKRFTEQKRGPVFPYKDGSWLPYRTIQAAYDKAFKATGSGITGSHSLRHSFAVRFLERTKDIYALQKVLGHADLKTTQVYAKYTNESVRKSFRLFHGEKDADEHGSFQNSFQNREAIQIIK